MRTFPLALGALAVAAFFHPASVAAQEAIVYPWCAKEINGAHSCSFTTFQQCQETVRGVGGFCSINPAYAEARAQVDPHYDEFVPLRGDR